MPQIEGLGAERLYSGNSGFISESFCGGFPRFGHPTSTSTSTRRMTTDEFVVPTKQIVSPSDLHAFLHSGTYELVNEFIENLSTSVEDTPISPDIKTSAVRRCKMTLTLECGCPSRNTG